MSLIIQDAADSDNAPALAAALIANLEAKTGQALSLGFVGRYADFRWPCLPPTPGGGGKMKQEDLPEGCYPVTIVRGHMEQLRIGMGLEAVNEINFDSILASVEGFLRIYGLTQSIFCGTKFLDPGSIAIMKEKVLKPYLMGYPSSYYDLSHLVHVRDFLYLDDDGNVTTPEQYTKDLVRLDGLITTRRHIVGDKSVNLYKLESDEVLAARRQRYREFIWNKITKWVKKGYKYDLPKICNDILKDSQNLIDLISKIIGYTSPTEQFSGDFSNVTKLIILAPLSNIDQLLPKLTNLKEVWGMFLARDNTNSDSQNLFKNQFNAGQDPLGTRFLLQYLAKHPEITLTLLPTETLKDKSMDKVKSDLWDLLQKEGYRADLIKLHYMYAYSKGSATPERKGETSFDPLLIFLMNHIANTKGITTQMNIIEYSDGISDVPVFGLTDTCTSTSTTTLKQLKPELMQRQVLYENANVFVTILSESLIDSYSKYVCNIYGNWTFSAKELDAEKPKMKAVKIEKSD
jgi:hypothetical protein